MGISIKFDFLFVLYNMLVVESFFFGNKWLKKYKFFDFVCLDDVKI